MLTRMAYLGAMCCPGKRFRQQRPVVDQHDAGDDHKFHADTGQARFLIGRAIGNRLRIERDDIGIGALLQATFAMRSGRRRLSRAAVPASGSFFATASIKVMLPRSRT